MAKRKRAIPQYGTVVLNGIEYYRTRVEDSDGNRVALYAKTPEKLYDKELEALEQIDSTTFRRRSPTVAEYCEKWLLMQSVLLLSQQQNLQHEQKVQYLVLHRYKRVRRVCGSCSFPHQRYSTGVHRE